MLETHLNSPVTRRRLRTGPAADHIDAFADWLHLHGYKPVSIDNRLTSLAAWTDWLFAAGFTAHDLLAGFEACKLAVEKEQRVPHHRGPNRHSLTAAALFIRFLQHQGELPLPASPPSAVDLWPTLGEFRSWMHKHRGLTETTLDVYQGILLGLLEMMHAPTLPRPCAPSSSIEHALTGSIVRRALSSRSAPSCDSSALRGAALRVWNTPSPVLPHGSSHPSPGFSSRRMSNG
jgi:hypothetical protein